MVVGFVYEGITDVPVLQAVVDAVLGPDYEPRFIQPDRDALSPSTGWTEVRKWCEQNGAGLSDYLTWVKIDLLVIHLDADVREQVRATNTADLCTNIKGWLRHGAKDHRLIIVIPAQAIEAWLVAAHVAVNPQLEQEPAPVRRLVQRGLITGSKDGKPIKQLSQYRNLSSKLTMRVAELRGVLHELDRFAGKLESAAARLGRPVTPTHSIGKAPRRGKHR